MQQRRALEAWENEGGATGANVLAQPRLAATPDPGSMSRYHVQPAKELTMHPTKDTLGANVRAQSVESLNRHLAAAIDLHAQAKRAHWNVRGPNFMAAHELFDKIAGRIDVYSDTLAERAAALGGTARGTIQTTVEWSFLAPYRLEIADEQSHLFSLSSAIAAFGTSTREAIATANTIGDPVTADIFTEVSRGLDSALWLLESHSPPDTHDVVQASLTLVRS